MVAAIRGRIISEMHMLDCEVVSESLLLWASFNACCLHIL